MLKFGIKYTDDFRYELRQAEDEGRYITDDIRKEHADIVAMIQENANDPACQERAALFYDKIQMLPFRSNFQYTEPSDLESIRNLRPKSGNDALDKTILKEENTDVLYNRIYGAWLGRCAGCLLGKPVEGWKKPDIYAHLKEKNNFPIHSYISNDVCGMPADDDTNYTIIGLKILTDYGKDFTSENVAQCWMQSLPVNTLNTAEIVAMRNWLNFRYPPESASYRNACREWIGAQIRADFFGYISPADPALGASLAYRDAAISHIKNGIYGEMWVAAMLSAAASMTADHNDPAGTAEKIIYAGLGEIPENCRLAEGIREAIGWKKSGKTYEEVVDIIHTEYDEGFYYNWCHVISNAKIVTAALLFGELDLEKTISRAVMAAFDTDCNGATSGSVLGMLLGADSLPAKWIDPLCDTLYSTVNGFDTVKISKLAAETMKYVIR